MGETATYTDRNGTTHQYSYDDRGRLTGDAVTHFGNANIDQTVASLGYTYDDAGNMATATSYNASGGVVNQVAETYDGFGQLAGDAQSHSGIVVSGTTPTVGYGYDASNGDRLTSMTYPNGRTINYNYNGSGGLDSAASRITSISDSNGLIQSYQYQGLNTPMVSTSGNGVVGTTVLDSLGRISSLTYTNSSGGVIDGFSYTYDADSNILTKTNLAFSNNSETYGYDRLNRLTSFARGTISSGTIASPSTSENWNYDGLGNWKSITVTTGGTTSTTSRNNNAQNQAYNISGSTLNYDANGNTLSNQVTGQTYVYDAWNHLVTVKNTSGVVIASYTYDGLGRRITQTEGGVTTDLYYSNEGQVIEEQQACVTVAQYVWSPFYVNQLVQETNSHGTFYVQQDANYNVTSITNSSGVVVERYVYDPYGQVTVLTAYGTGLGIGITNSAYGQNIGFQGEYSDPDTGLIASLTRWLNPATGQWNTQDPTGAMYMNGLDLDQDDLSNPVSLLDPSGLAAPPLAHKGQNWQPMLNGIQQAVDVTVAVAPDAVPIVVGAAEYVGSDGADDSELENAVQQAEDDGMAAMEDASSSSTSPPASPSGPSGQPPATPAQPTSPAQPANPGELAEPPGSGSGDSGSQPSDCPEEDKPESKYSNLPDPKNVGPGKNPTPSQRQQIYDQNRQANNGVLRSDGDGRELTPGQKGQKGVTPDPNEATIDHIDPKSNGGTNASSNLQVLSRQENRAKSNN